MAKTNSDITNSKKFCHFCVNNVQFIDYTDVASLNRFLSSYGKIVPRRRSGVCAWHQRKLARAIKRARIVGLLPFTTR